MLKKKYPMIIIAILAVGVALLVFFYLQMSKVIEWTPVNAMKLSSAPQLADDNDTASLIRGLDFSLSYLENQDEEEVLRFGPHVVPIFRVRETLSDFKAKLQQHGLTPPFYKYLRQNYQFYKSAAKQMQFTGYYEAMLKGSLQQSQQYPYPLYSKPEDLYRIDLSKFYFFEKHYGLPRYIRGRAAEGNTIIPYYSREQIDVSKKLAGKNLELVYINNPIAVFFLQIQGSGIIQLDSGEILRVNYADSNGHPYRAIGRLLLEQNVLTREDISMQSIRKYLEENPQQMQEVFNYNPSYVFFRTVEEGPMGSIQVPLTPYRSIATDKRLFPRGVLCFIQTEVPLFDEQGKIVKWQPKTTFVFNQDTGGAIKGPGKVDLFTGHGPASELVAGHMKQEGKLYFLIKKDPAVNR